MNKNKIKKLWSNNLLLSENAPLVRWEREREWRDNMPFFKIIQARYKIIGNGINTHKQEN